MKSSAAGAGALLHPAHKQVPTFGQMDLLFSIFECHLTICDQCYVHLHHESPRKHIGIFTIDLRRTRIGNFQEKVIATMETYLIVS